MKPITPLLAVDCAVFKGDRLLLIQRKNEPFKNWYALPGGFVDVGETVEEACKREMMEETSVNVTNLKLIGIYSNPKRDSRGHTVTIAFIGETKSSKPKGGDDALTAQFVKGWKNLKMAFDQKQIVKDALAVKDKKTGFIR